MMPFVRTPIRSLLVLVILLISASGTFAAGNAFEAQLKSECDELVASAMKSPHGLLWGGQTVEVPEAMPAAPSKPGTIKKPVKPPLKPVKPPKFIKLDEFNTRQTAAAGLILFLAGEQLQDPTLTKAAAEAARALSTVQDASGQIPAIGTLGTKIGGRDEPGALGSRSPTCAALGLMLTVIQGSEKPDEKLTQAATKAATWLGTQEQKDGAWPGSFVDRDRKSIRLIRLDVVDARNCTAALLLAANVLGDPAIAQRANDAITRLLALRVKAKSNAAALWLPAYTLTGEPVTDQRDLPNAIDTIASQYTMQSLLAASLLGQNAADASGNVSASATLAAEGLFNAAKALNSLPREANEWSRYYQPATGETLVPADGDGMQLFDNDGQGSGGPMGDSASLFEVVAAAKEIQAAGLQKYLTNLETTALVFWPSHRIGIMLCGLGNGALATQFPAKKSAVAAYIEKKSELWATFAEDMPADLQPRLERLQLLLIRTKLEAIQ